MRSSFARGWAIASVLPALALAGCVHSRGGPIPYDVQNFGRPDAPKPAILPENYQLAPGDKLKIDVFGVKDMSGEYTVDLAGHVGFPLIGNVDAIGLTTEQLAARLDQQLGQKYLNNPHVSVGIIESSGRMISVDGSVNQAGSFPVTGDMTLVDAVALARGTNQDANPRRVAIFRRIDGKPMVAAFDLTDIRRGLAENPKVYPGDIVYVDGNGFHSTLRDILGTLPVLALFKPY